ncbi:Xaa-Pro aminopeptidase P like protein [Verticillium longisporum]|uniref:Xaa-Pro aminopeptidase P like protein n=1 Tax=Verticillium longisporum TaxID=100787 RepID=A0A8I2ZQ32_VERLO|nr:Xaa-Pro aminopeptidase P like protein [Verticillium longisporum]
MKAHSIDVAAVIHYKPERGSCPAIDPEAIYLCDSGAQYLDGTTDVTRTVHFGCPTAAEKLAYTLVLKGNIALDSAIFPKGTTGFALDCLARQHLWGDQRLPHDSGNAVDEEGLKQLGVYYHNITDIEGVNQLAAKRGYKNRDEIIVSPEKMGDVYEDKVKSFFNEHLHEDEEIRYVRDGRGYFDVRSRDDEWVRIRVEKSGANSIPTYPPRSVLDSSGDKALRAAALVVS